MKKLEELGASPAPWSLMDDMTTVVCDIDDGVVGEVAVCDGGDADESNARLIAATPELYQALLEMQECFDYIRSTAWFMDANFTSIEKMNLAQNEAHKALAKAAGEEAK